MLFFVLALLSLTSASPLNFTFPEVFLANVTLTNPPPTANLIAGARCERESQGYWLVEDCFAAVQALYIDRVITQPNKVYEFRSRSTAPKTRNEWVEIPLVYTVSKGPLPFKY